MSLKIPQTGPPVKPGPDPVMDLLRRHRDLCRDRAVIQRRIEDVERQIGKAENSTRCAGVLPGAASQFPASLN